MPFLKTKTAGYGNEFSLDVVTKFCKQLINYWNLFLLTKSRMLPTTNAVTIANDLQYSFTYETTALIMILLFGLKQGDSCIHTIIRICIWPSLNLGYHGIYSYENVSTVRRKTVENIHSSAYSNLILNLDQCTFTIPVASFHPVYS